MRPAALALALVLVAGCGGSGKATSGATLDGGAATSSADGSVMGSTSSGGAGGSAGGVGGSSSGADAGQAGGQGGQLGAVDSGADQGGADGGADAAVDATAVAVDAMASTGAPDLGPRDPGPGVIPLPGMPGDYICPLGASHEACCQVLCECVTRVCGDVLVGKEAAVNNCKATCNGLADGVARCHVFQCYGSVNPNVRRDRKAFCDHAANIVSGGACPAGVR